MRGLIPFLIAGAVSLANAAPLADRMEALPAGAVRPRGWMLDRARALAKGYVGCMDGVDADFRRTWTREFRPDPANFSWEHGAWSFEGGGYWFDALVRLAAQLDDPDLMAQAKRRLAPVLDDARPEAISLLSWLDRSDAQAVGRLTAPDTSFPLSKCGYLGRALTAYWQVTRDPRVPGALAHAFDDVRFLRAGAALHLPTAAFDAWKLTGDAKTAAALDAFYADLSPIDSPVTRYARLPDVSKHNMTDDPEKDVDWRLQHGVMLNEGMLAWLRGWQWTKRTEYRDAVFAWMDWLRDNATQPHGVIVADEAFGHPGGSRGTETCTVAATIWLKLQLLAATGDGRWADEAERALFNAAPVCANRDFTAHVYFQSPNRTTPLKPAYRRNDTPLTPYSYRRKHYPMCCTADLTRIIPAAVQYKWLTDDEGAVAALYGPDEATLTAAGVKVRLRTVTDYPFDERVTIHVHPERESEWTLKLRIPAWCGKASVAVNGLAQEVSAERGFARVCRVWCAGDVVTLDLPMAPSFERGRDLNVGADYGVVRYGPFLMAAPLAEFDDDNPVRGSKGDWKLDPARVLRGARVIRRPLGPGFDWPLDAPVKLEVETSSGRVALVPYGCTRFRISMFPLVADPPRRPLVILNEDNDHFMFGHIWSGAAQRGEPLTVAYIHEYLDKYLQPAVTHVFVNPNCNTVYYGSEVETRAWEIHREIGCPCKHAPVAEDMWRRGLDPYATMIARVREKGISPWLSMRMNDVHDATETNLCRTSRFWRRHPEFRRDPKAQTRSGSGGWGRFCYDYAHPEVREHQLAVAVELMTRYDADGIEFDWMRWPVHLKPGDERKQAGCLTEFMRQARREADRIGRRRGRPLQVAVRVHSNPDEALDLGTDVFAWAREGLVDMVIPCNFLVMTDYQLPLRDWKRRMAAANPKVTVIPGTDSSVRPEASNWHDNVPISAAELRGFFDLMFREGAEGFYFFNHFNHGRKSDRGRFLSEPGLLDGERIARQSRAYPVSFLESTRDRTPEHTRVQFPLKLTAPARIRVAAGSPPPGDFVFVKLAFFEAGPSKELLATVRLNGVAPVACGETDVGEWLGKHAASVSAVCLKFPSAAAKEGTNEVVLGGVPGEKAVASACELYEPVNGEIVK